MPAGARLATTLALANRYMTSANWDKLERLGAFGAARGRSLLEVAFAWLASRPVVASVIAGATAPEQVEANVRAAAWSPSADEIAEVDAILAADHDAG
jgi:aryl-alcohol dehydrogenase-like predicted oxidoreductase